MASNTEDIKESSDTDSTNNKNIIGHEDKASSEDIPPKKERWLPKAIQDGVEYLLKRLFFWEDDQKKIGGLIRFLHHGIIYTLVAWYIMIHTALPSYFLFLIFYAIIFIIWLHHILIGGCVLSRLEQKFIGDTSSFVDPIMEAFHIPVTSESTEGIVILGSSLILAMLTFELIARTILNISSWVSFFIEHS
jgi:hypothetical protein